MFKTQSIMVRKSCYQEPEVADHISSTVRKLREVSAGNESRTPTGGLVPHTSGTNLPSSMNSLTDLPRACLLGDARSCHVNDQYSPSQMVRMEWVRPQGPPAAAGVCSNSCSVGQLLIRTRWHFLSSDGLSFLPLLHVCCLQT